MSNHTDALLENPKFLRDIKDDDSIRTLATRYGVSFGFIQNLRSKDGLPLKEKVARVQAGSVAKQSAGESETHAEDGATSYVRFSQEVWGFEDYCEFIRQTGQDPDAVTFTWGWTSNPNGGFWNKLNNVRVKPVTIESEAPVVFESILDDIRSFTFVPEPVAYDATTAIIMPADLQVGKVDWNGGSKETAAQALHSFHEFAEYVRDSRPQEIHIVDAGDPIENVFNTSSQMGTNDLDLPHQIAAASHIFLKGIQILAPLAPVVGFKSVPSNHGAFRVGPKSPAGDAHADFGIVIAEMLRDSLSLNPASFGHVSIQTPEPYMESLYFQSSGSDIGVVHGHQAGGPDKIGEWWAKQSHGNMPVSKARILLAGHWHSLRVYQSGDGRWVIVGPSSDRGSTWYTNLKGEQSQSGMLAFTTANNSWSDLRIL
ncbi:hypothetical protein [Frigoribacterium sp. UYMn621]|uniref:hypothetical protein n=1 Tax=Frigoribacterium sp. UYMn621 TaxID=3156343 RepID=UPI003393D391